LEKVSAAEADNGGEEEEEEEEEEELSRDGRLRCI